MCDGLHPDNGQVWAWGENDKGQCGVPMVGEPGEWSGRVVREETGGADEGRGAQIV